jgi:hypothetical protein
MNRHNRVVKPAPLEKVCLNSTVENFVLHGIDEERELNRPEGDGYVAEGHA